jgi:hypothetical protein
MACNSKENTLKWLVDKNIISQTREILDTNKFNMVNIIFTERAVKEYGLNVQDKFLFTVSESEGAVGIAKDRAIRKKIRRAEPNIVLFDTLDNLIEVKDTKEANARENGINLEDDSTQPGFMREEKPAADNETKIASSIYELIPDVTKEKIEEIYNNYVNLMNRTREGKAMSLETFKSLMQTFQVYNYKDTYIFGQWDSNNAVFVTRVNSSPSSKQLLAEALPNLVSKGVSVISFVPEDIASKYKRSGYLLSKDSYDFNFKGEDMQKFAAVSNPEVSQKIFGKNISEVTSKEIEEYNENVPFKYSPVSIDAALINKANKNLSSILQTYLANFGIQVKDISEMQQRIGIDSFGFADILNKIAYVKNREDLPIIAGEFIAYMMQYNPLVKDIIRELSKTNDYKGLSKSKYFKIIGELISEDLQNKIEGKHSKSLISKIKDLVKRFFDLFKTVPVDMINRNIGIISNNILQQNKNMITASLYKPGAFGKPTKQVSIKDALAKDKFGNIIVLKLSKKGLILTGSIALSEQGTIRRPDENPLHDIDWTSPFSRKETNEIFLSEFPDAIKVRDIVNSDYVTDTYLIAPEGYSIRNYQDKVINNKIIIDSYEVVDSNGNVVGTFKNEFDTEINELKEIVTGVEAKVIDLFSYPNLSAKNIYAPSSYETEAGDLIQLSNWIDIFDAKLKYARYKDLWDYNRFIPNTITDVQVNKGIENASLDVEDAIALLEENQAEQVAEAMAERLRTGLGISYQIIDPDVAIKILEDAPIKYNGEPAFYYGNTAYFIRGNFNLNTVLHEFAHPLIAAIRRDNPDLFENLFSQVAFTTEGKELIEKVKRLYPELKEGSALFKEEVIVHALQKASYDKVNNEVESQGFEGFIKNLLYAIKKILRNLFGQRIKVSDITADTSLAQLADKMIDSEIFDLSEVPSKKDYLMFLKSEKTRIDKLDNTAKEIAKGISADAMMKVINIFYSNATASLQSKRKLKKSSPEYRMLENSILKQGTNELLDGIKNSLAGYQTVTKGGKKSREQVVDEALVSEIERIDTLTRQSTNLVHSFNTVNNIVDNIVKDLVELKTNKNLGSRSVMTLVGIYKNLLAGWEDLMYNTDQIMVKDFALSVDNPFSQLLGAVNTNIARGNTILKDIYKESSVKFYKEYTGYMHDFVQDQLKSNLMRSLKKLKTPLTEEEIEEFYNKVIDDALTPQDMEALVQRGANKTFVQDFINEYNTYKIDEGKIRDLLEGKIEDLNWFNRFLEAYTSSTDPIVGGLAVYLQNVRTDAMQEALQQSERFRGKLEKALEKVGFNKLSTRQLLKLTTFEDTVAIFNDKGELTERMVYTLQNEFMNYRFDKKSFENKYEKARESGNVVEIAEAARELRKFNMDYMWDRYLPEVYEADELFESEIGKLAWLDRQTALDKFRTETTKYQDELERFDKYSSAQALWREYEKLFELTYADGTPKVDDPKNGVYDLSKATILREYKQKTKKYKTFIPKEGSLQNAYNEFINLLISQNIKRNSNEFNDKVDQWVKQNLRTAYTEEYHTSKQNDIARLRELQAKENETVARDFDQAAAYEEIYNLINGFRDEQNQPIPSELGPDRLKRIKELQEEINDFKARYNRSTGLTDEQLAEFDKYQARIDAGQELSSIEKSRYLKLLEKQGQGLSLAERQEMNGIYKRLGELSSKVPTEYYIDAINYYLNKLEQPEVTPENVDEFINSPEFVELVYSDEKFGNWFINNHVEVERYIDKKPTLVRERLMAYSITIPSNPDHILKTTLIDNTTGKEVTFDGIPNARHSKYVVKNEYRTIPLGEDWENYIGVYKDPAGNWLPRKYEPGKANSAADSKYINTEYSRLKGTPEFELIELFKDFSIEIQKNIPMSSRLAYDMPRFFIDNNLEILQGTNMSDRVAQIKGSFKAWVDDNFRNSAEAEFERSHNFNPNQIFVNTDLLGEEISYVPIRGTFNMDPEKVSPDIIRSFFRYQMSAVLQSKLIESASLVEGILETLDDPSNAPKDPVKVNRQKFKAEGILESVSKAKGKTYNRREQVRSLLMRELYGKNVVGIEESNPWLFKLTNFMQKTAGVATLAVNIPSDLKNRYGQIVQNVIEASSGQFINLKSLALGKVWSSKAMVEWSAKGIYTTGQQSLTVQMIQFFDPAFKTEAEYGKSPGRSMIKDLIDGSWMYDFRKFGELEAALQLFGGFMHHKYIDQTLSDGTVIPVRYIDAWELDADGVMTLKNGIDPEWGTKQIYHTYIKGETLEQIANKYFITVDELKAKNEIKDVTDLETGTELVIAKGAKLKRFKNQFQAVSRQLYGNYDQFGQPEGNMYLAYRMFFFMRKWAVPGFQKRFGMSTKKGNWGGKRYDWALGQTTRGYYITSFMAGYKLLKSWGNYYNYMDEQDKADVKRMLSEGFTTLLLALGALLIFGYDDDDEDRFEKMKERSGPAFTPDFKLRGYMTNHMLFLLLGVHQETSTYAPIPGLGLDEYSKFLSVTSTSFNSTIKVYMKIFEDIVNTSIMNESAFYKRDVGPYPWQKEGSAKIITHMLSAFGLSGRTGDPETLVENMERFSKL